MAAAKPSTLYAVGERVRILESVTTLRPCRGRGYALPQLQTRFGGLGASLILGALWAAWHLINATIPGLERYWYTFPAFALFVIAQTVLFTWISNNASGSVLLAERNHDYLRLPKTWACR